MKNIKIELKWALIFMAVSLLWMYLEKVFGLHDENIDKHPVYTNLFALPAIGVYVFALLDKRRNYYNGSMSYKQGFVSGLLVTLFVTILSPLTQYITTFLITPDYFPNAIDHAVSNGLMKRYEAEKFFSYQNYIKQGLIFAPVMGILTSAIVAIFTRKKGFGKEEQQPAHPV